MMAWSGLPRFTELGIDMKTKKCYILMCLAVSVVSANFDRIPDDQIVAATLILEAGGEYAPGAMEAVYEVIRNRALRRNRSQREIVLARLQFSCWNNIERRTELFDHARRHPRWPEAYQIVTTYEGNITSGADHYHAIRVNPRWSEGMKLTKQVGNHLFYKN